VFQSDHILVPHACGKRRDIFKGENGIHGLKDFSGQPIGKRATHVTNKLEILS